MYHFHPVSRGFVPEPKEQAVKVKATTSSEAVTITVRLSRKKPPGSSVGPIVEGYPENHRVRS